MNIAFFLTPKKDVTWVHASGSVEHALLRLQASGFSAVPMVDDEGKYAGTLTEGDLLWYFLDLAGAEASPSGSDHRTTKINAVPRRTTNAAVHIDAEVEALMERIADQNFVPVVDDREVFIGIVTRKRIIEHARVLEPPKIKSAKPKEPSGTFGACRCASEPRREASNPASGGIFSCLAQ